MVKNILILINPASGKDFEVLSFLHNHLHKHNVKADIRITMEKGDITRIIQETKKEQFDAIAVYGGDGSIHEAVDALYNSDTPIVILPGGTANILAKELGIPEQIEKAIPVITKKSTIKKKIDLGLANKTPFMLRLNTGPLASMVINADTNLKKTVGQIAYSITFIQELQNAKKQTFNLLIDDKEYVEEGIAIMVANSGNIGFPGISFLPSIKVDDGKLDILIIKEADISYLTTAIKDALVDKTLSNLTHLKGKQIKIKMSKKQHITCDDTTLHTDSLDITVVPKNISVLVPAK